jgi:hypothetical protein
MNEALAKIDEITSHVVSMKMSLDTDILLASLEELRSIVAAQPVNAADEGDSYDFTDADQNPWLLSHQEADRAAALRR